MLKLDWRDVFRKPFKNYSILPSLFQLLSRQETEASEIPAFWQRQHFLAYGCHSIQLLFARLPCHQYGFVICAQLKQSKAREMQNLLCCSIGINAVELCLYPSSIWKQESRPNSWEQNGSCRFIAFSKAPLDWQGRLPALLLSPKTGFPVRQSACFIPPGKRQTGLYFSTPGASWKGEAPSVSAVMEAKPKEKKCDHFRGTKSSHFCCYILGTKIAGTGPSCWPQRVWKGYQDIIACKQQSY